MQHFMTYKFIYDVMYMKDIVKSYLKSCVRRFQMIFSCCLRDSELQFLLRDGELEQDDETTRLQGLVTLLSCSLF